MYMYVTVCICMYVCAIGHVDGRFFVFHCWKLHADI
jgi:hypothetical protein